MHGVEARYIADGKRVKVEVVRAGGRRGYNEDDGLRIYSM
jgi:hypothetical protein